jgi:RNA polymerase sigma factor (sigma-70 family)
MPTRVVGSLLLQRFEPRLYCSQRLLPLKWQPTVFFLDSSLFDNSSELTSLGSMDTQSSFKRIGAISDDDLAGFMKAAQAGDQDAYIQLLQEVTIRLRRIVRRYRGFITDEDIEDLVQDTLLSLHSVRATYDPQRPFMPWILAITRNRLADGARRYARTSGREVNTDCLDVTFANENANTTADVFREEDLRNAIEDLPAAQRTAVEMLKLRELSLKEAASVSGMSIGALKVATHRAMIALRKMLVKTNEPKY